MKMEISEEPFTVESDEYTFIGMAYIPKVGKKIPFVVFKGGSGILTYNQDDLGKRLISLLNSLKIAVVRYNDRPNGMYQASTHKDMADDMIKVIDLVRTKYREILSIVGLCGYSEGGLVASIASAIGGRPNFLITLASPCGDMVEFGVRQIRQDYRHTEEWIRTAEVKIFETAFRLLSEEGNWNDLRKPIREKCVEMNSRRAGEWPVDANEEQRFQELSRDLNTLHKRSLYSYDYEKYMQSIDCPVLSLYAEKDERVEARSTCNAYEEACRKCGAPIYTDIYDGLAHDFSVDGRYDVFAKDVVPSIVDWIYDPARWEWYSKCRNQKVSLAKRMLCIVWLTLKRISNFF